MQEIKFGNQILPAFPFVWVYGSHMLPVVKSEVRDVKEMTNVKDLPILEGYEVEYRLMEQQALTPDTMINVSFHTWLFQLNGGGNDMSSAKFKTDALAGVFEVGRAGGVEPNYAYAYGAHGAHGAPAHDAYRMAGICPGRLDRRWVIVHDGKLSPKFDNSLRVVRLPATFLTVVVHEKLKKACITLHRITA